MSFSLSSNGLDPGMDLGYKPLATHPGGPFQNCISGNSSLREPRCIKPHDFCCTSAWALAEPMPLHRALQWHVLYQSCSMGSPQQPRHLM